MSDRPRPVFTPGPNGPPPPPRDRLETKGELTWEPTGRFRFSTGWFGRVILEMQEELSPGFARRVTRWRRAPRGTRVMLPYVAVDFGSGDFTGYWPPAAKDQDHG